MKNSIKQILSIRSLILFTITMKFFQIPLLSAVPFFHMLFKLVPYICFCWTVIILVADFIEKRALWRNTGTVFLVLFLLSYSVTTVINFHYSFSDNLQLVFWMGMEYILLYYFDRDREVSYHIMTMKIVGTWFLILTLISAIISNAMFFAHFSGEINVDGTGYRIGFRSDRLFGIFASPNYGSLYCIIAIVILLFWILSVHRRAIKGLLCLLIVPLYLYIILTVSRTGEVSLAFATALFVFGLIYVNLIKKLKFARTAILSIVISLICGLFIILPFSSIRNMCTQYLKNSTSSNSQISSTSNSKSAPSNTEITNSQQNIITVDPGRLEVARYDYSEDDPSNGRTSIWNDAVKLLLPTNPVFGVSSLGYINFAKEKFPQSFIAIKNKFSMHNDFVTLLVCCGIVGFILILIFIIIVSKKILSFLWINRSNPQILKKIGFPLSVLLILASTMFYSDAVLVMYAEQSIIFWVCLGYVMYVIDPYPKSNFIYQFFNKVYRKIKGSVNINCLRKR